MQTMPFEVARRPQHAVEAGSPSAAVASTRSPRTRRRAVVSRTHALGMGLPVETICAWREQAWRTALDELTSSP